MKFNILKFVFLILLCLTLYLGYTIIYPKERATEKPHKLPKLYVDGKYLRRNDTKEAIILKGVSTLSFAYYEPNNELMEVLEIVKDWGINLLGIYIDPFNMKNRSNKLDYTINWAENNGIYVLLTPIDRDNSYLESANQYAAYMGHLAKKYRNKNNVIYGLAAEPNMAWNDWRNYADITIEAISKESPDVIIAMTGINFGREINFNDIPTYKNIIYDFHEYPARNEKELTDKTIENNLKFSWNNYYKNFPIIIGEFGGVWEKDFGSEGDLVFIQKVIDEVNKNRLSYTAYTIDPEMGLTLIDRKTKLVTNKGKLIKNDLTKYPPTNF